MRLDDLDIASLIMFGFIGCSALFRVKRTPPPPVELPDMILPAIIAPAMGIGGVASHHPHHIVLFRVAEWTYAVTAILILWNRCWGASLKAAERQARLEVGIALKEDRVYNDWAKPDPE